MRSPDSYARDRELSAWMRHAIQQARRSRRREGKFNTNFIKLASGEQWTELCELDHAEACVDDFDRVCIQYHRIICCE